MPMVESGDSYYNLIAMQCHVNWPAPLVNESCMTRFWRAIQPRRLERPGTYSRYAMAGSLGIDSLLFNLYRRRLQPANAGSMNQFSSRGAL